MSCFAGVLLVLVIVLLLLHQSSVDVIENLYRYGNSYGESIVQAFFVVSVAVLLVPCPWHRILVQYKYIQTITSGTTVGKFLGTIGYSVLQCRV